MFSEFPSESIINPMGPKAIQHHYVTSHHHHNHHPQTIMIGSANGDINQQHQRLPDVHQILPGNSPKMDHYKTTSLDYGHVKIESSPYATTNGKIEYINGTGGIVKLGSYSPNSSDTKLEYVTTNGGQYSPNTPTSVSQQIEHLQIFQQPQPIDGSQQSNIINGTDGRKSDENLNNISGSPTPIAINSVSSGDRGSSVSPNKKPSDKKKNDSNGVKKKKTR